MVLRPREEGLRREEEAGRREQADRPEEESQEEKRREGRSGVLLGFLRFTRLLPDVWRLVRGVLSHIKIKSLSVDLTVGLDDPADTALFVGSLWAPILLMRPSYAHAIRVTPSFEDGVVLTGRAHLELRLRPIRIVPPILRFGCSRSGRRLLGGLISGRWRRKS